MNLRAEVMALPPDERLPYALILLNDLTGEDHSALIAAWPALRASHARMLARLWQARGRVVPFEALTAMYDECQRETLRIYACRIRRDTGLHVECKWGVGYRLVDIAAADAAIASVSR